MKISKEELKLKRHRRIRLKIFGTKERPRLVIRRSLKHLHATLVDDIERKILFSFSTLDKAVREKFMHAGNIKAAEFFGEVFGQQLKERGINRIVFDRAGYLYHGRIKAFAESLRKQGVEF